MKKTRLLPDKYPQLSFFTADIVEWSAKADRHSMEHPMFILSKKGVSKESLTYEHGDVAITITPSAAGYATIWDKDILIYAVSQLIEGQNRGRDLNRTVRVTLHDMLVSTNRSTGGESYERLKEALVRLRGTTITTNLETAGKKRTRGFGLIDDFEIVEQDATGRMAAIEITLSRWLFNAITGKEVLTLNRDYFRLSGGLERRIYELARKHCGTQAYWCISIELLQKKSGSQSSSKEFRRALKEIVAHDEVPDYHLEIDPKGVNLLVTSKRDKK